MRYCVWSEGFGEDEPEGGTYEADDAVTAAEAHAQNLFDHERYHDRFETLEVFVRNLDTDPFREGAPTIVRVDVEWEPDFVGREVK